MKVKTTKSKASSSTRPSILYTRMKSACDSSNNTWINLPVRYKITAFVVLATCIDYITRVNINVAIVTMVKQNTTHSDLWTEVCPLQDPGKYLEHEAAHVIDPEEEKKRFDWSPKTQGVILGSFWYSYMFMQIPSGRLAEEFGGKWIVAISLIGSGVVNLITPLVASSVPMLIFSRIVLGFMQGGIFPSCFAMLHKWMPIKERSIGFAFMDVGATIGSVIATTGSGYLSEHGFAGGWPSVFYMSGLVSLLALFAWIPYVQSDPKDHPEVSKEELKYIYERGASEMEGNDHVNNNANRIRPRVPWKQILTSGPVIAIVISKFSLGWSYLMLLSKLPAYLHDVLHIAPTQNGLLNASLYLTSCLSLLASSHVSEHVIHSNYMSRTSCRKMFQAIACFGTTICLSLVPSVGCNTEVVMFFLLFGGFFSGFNAGGDVPVAGEISHNFPATIYAMANMAGCSCGFLAPYIVGVILESGGPDTDLLSKWASVFYISSFISFSGGVFFLIFGSAKVQSWDNLPEDEHDLHVYHDNDTSSRSRSVSDGQETIIFTKDQVPYKSCS